jgi:hypothetical protein
LLHLASLKSISHTGFREHDIAGLEIPMRHAVLVRLVQCVGSLDRMVRS